MMSCRELTSSDADLIMGAIQIQVSNSSVGSVKLLAAQELFLYLLKQSKS